MKEKLTFKRDVFWNARGKYSRYIKVYCRRCNALALTYQKDGPGNLRRLYFDRIFSPKEFTTLHNKKLSDIQDLRCNRCKEILGVPYIYQKEKRKTFRLFQDAVIKKIMKLN